MSFFYEEHFAAKSEELVASFTSLKEVDTAAKTLETFDVPNQASFGPSSDLLVEKIKQTRAEIDILQNSPLSVLPESTDLQYDLLEKELEKSISELTETRTFISVESNEIEIEIQQEEELSHQLSDLIVDSLARRLGEQNFETTDAAGAREKLKGEIAEKRIKANAYLIQLLNESSKFCNKYFNLPSEQDFNDQQKKLRSADRTITVRNMFCLKDIISELMNKCFDEPNEPYIILNKRYWPPYIELLLRCQIVVRHQDDPRRIKLIPFHL